MSQQEANIPQQDQWVEQLDFVDREKLKQFPPPQADSLKFTVPWHIEENDMRLQDGGEYGERTEFC